ncbi:MAG: hypothetical protein ACLGIS_16395 [Actinomycetes bacterium]
MKKPWVRRKAVESRRERGFFVPMSLKALFPFLALAAAVAAEPGFLQKLPPEKFRAAGLEKLTPAELAQLEVLFEEHKRGELQTVQAEAATKIAAAEDKVRQAEAKQAAAGSDKGGGPGWLKALITLESTNAKPEKAEVFETRLKGRFKGWSGKTMFTLEDGQRWQQVNSGEYSPVDEEDSPRIKIYPGSLGSYWLEVEGHRQRVRVKPVSLR